MIRLIFFCALASSTVRGLLPEAATNTSGTSNVAGTSIVGGSSNVAGTSNVSGSSSVAGTSNAAGPSNVSGPSNSGTGQVLMKTAVNASNPAADPKLGEAKAVSPQGTSFFSFPFGSKLIGDSCKSTDDCKIAEAFCTDGKCQCSTEYVRSSNNKTCLIRPRTLLASCAEDFQCEQGLNATGLVGCIGYKCICVMDAYLVNGKCYKKKVLGNPCEVDEECSIQFSSCIQNVCACDDGLEPDEDDARCILLKATDAKHANCTHDAACFRFGDDFVCDDGVCRCRPGLHLSASRCVPEKKLGDPCDTSSECVIDTEVRLRSGSLRECKQNKCSCIKGYRTDTNHNVCRSGSSIIQASLGILLVSLMKWAL